MPKLLFTPVCAQGVPRGPLGPSHFKYFPVGFGTKLAPYMNAPKTTTNQQKEHSKNVPFQNGGQKSNFHFAKTVT